MKHLVWMKGGPKDGQMIETDVPLTEALPDMLFVRHYPAIASPNPGNVNAEMHEYEHTETKHFYPPANLMLPIYRHVGERTYWSA